MIIIKAIIWIMLLPFKLLFFWVPKADDSYDTDDDEWFFWKEHGHNW